VRSDQDFSWRICIANIREQEQRQESTMSTVHIHPPLAIHVIAAIDVPTSVSGIAGAGKPNWDSSTNAFALNPTTWSEQPIVGLPEFGGRTSICERGRIGTINTNDGLGPSRRISTVDTSCAQFVFDDFHACSNSIWRDGSSYDKKAVFYELVCRCPFHVRTQAVYFAD
jgi:hypothetical protein